VCLELLPHSSGSTTFGQTLTLLRLLSAMGSEPIIGSEGKRKWGEKCNSASGDTFRDLELVEL